MDSQLKAVLEHLAKYDEITSWDAFEEYGITRLSAIIYILRHDKGLDIETVTVKTKNRYGNVCQYARYILKG